MMDQATMLQMVENAIQRITKTPGTASCVALQVAIIKYFNAPPSDETFIWHPLVLEYRKHSKAVSSLFGFLDIRGWDSLPAKQQEKIRIERLTAFGIELSANLELVASIREAEIRADHYNDSMRFK